MENSPVFISYKKVLVFGTEGSGKTSLTKTLEKGKFCEETSPDTGKNILYFILYFI